MRPGATDAARIDVVDVEFEDGSTWGCPLSRRRLCARVASTPRTGRLHAAERFDALDRGEIHPSFRPRISSGADLRSKRPAPISRELS